MSTPIVLVNGIEIPADAVLSFVVDMDLDQPYMAVIKIVVGKDSRRVDQYMLGETVEIQDSGHIIFTGELAVVEPLKQEGLVALRAFDKLNRDSRRHMALKVGAIVTTGAALRYFGDLVRALHQPPSKDLATQVQMILLPLRLVQATRPGGLFDLRELANQIQIMLTKGPAERTKMVRDVQNQMLKCVSGC